MLTKMTSEQATTFNRFSIYNALTVVNSLPCGCIPYQDVVRKYTTNSAVFCRCQVKKLEVK